jgi:hypothetical protein
LPPFNSTPAGEGIVVRRHLRGDDDTSEIGIVNVLGRNSHG